MSPFAGFSNLVDLLSVKYGGQALYCSDDFFAEMHNLVNEGRGVFIPDKYTERGKWMDGWESRRKRIHGHDWCILKLGLPGMVKAFDIDTNHFLGNHPPYASIEGCWMPESDELDDLQSADWSELLPQSNLQKGAQNLFVSQHNRKVTHLKLHIYPDGGVARFRAYGEPKPEWVHGQDDMRFINKIQSNEHDLAALRNGGTPVVCSDMFFGKMRNLIAPGRAAVMGEGWETRRSRNNVENWIIVQLGAPGKPRFIVMDTNHFKGNYPESFSLHGIYAPDSRITELSNTAISWQCILPRTTLTEHTEHFFRDEIQSKGPFTHVQLKIHPDGGVSRMRVYGELEEE